MELNNKDDERLQEAVEGIRQAVQGEREDELFYDYLIEQAPSMEEKEIIGSIRDDERRHNSIFRRIYGDFTSREIPEGEDENFETPESYIDGIKRALFGELRAVEKYREIMKRLPHGVYRDVLFDIITDELKHASKYNYLFTLNSTTNSAENNISGSNNADMGGTLSNTMVGSTNSDMGDLENTNMGSMMNNSMRAPQNNTAVNNTTTGTTNNSIGNTSGINTTGSTTGGSANATNNSPMSGNDTNIVDTSDFTPDQWVKYIRPLIDEASKESQEGTNPQHIYEKYILAGVLVGLGMEPRDAIDQVEDWEQTAESKLLAMGKMSRYFS